MSIFSSVKKAVKKAATYTYNTVNKAASAVKKAASSVGGSLSTASAINSIGGKTSTTTTTSPTNSGTGKSSSSNAVANLVNNPGPSTKLPVTITGGKQKTSSPISDPTMQAFVNSMIGPEYGPAYSGPRTITKDSTTATTQGLSTSKSLVGNKTAPLTSTSIAGTAPITVPSNPTSTNPGSVDTTGLAGTTAGLYTQKADGTFELVKDTQTDADTIKKETDRYKSIFGEEPQSVYDDPEVRRAQKERQRIQEALLAPTSELNAVIAKQNQDLLQLRQTGSQEGVTEAVYGGQSNAINYNAAIRALPLQASIASLQGDLKLAQDYVTELTAIKSDQIKSQYEYNKGLFQSIESALDTKDERAYEEMKTANDRAYAEEQDLIKLQDTLLQSAVSQGAPQTVINRISNAKTRRDAIAAAGQYGSAPNTQITQLDNGETVVVDKTTGRIVSNLGGAKSQGSGSFSTAGLTPEQASDPFIQKLANSAGGKPITDTFAQQLNKGLTVLGQIGTLETNIKDVKTGPIAGRFRGANPWDTNAQAIKAQLNAIVPNLARGVYGEVGVLTDADIQQYSKTLPNLTSTEDIRNAVLGITVDLIGKSIKRNLEINAANGKDVSGFIDIYTEMQSTRDSIFSQIPGYKGASSSSGNVDYTATLDSIFK